MTDKPRVTAAHAVEGHTDHRQCGPGHTSPSALVSVDFDLHDHEAALAALDIAVAKVRAQIEETKP